MDLIKIQEELFMKISVRVHEVYDNENSKVKGLASAALAGQFAVNGIKIVEGKKGLFVTMPSKLNDEGEYVDMFFPITKDSRMQLNNAVLKAYELKLEELASGEVESEDNEQSEDDGEDFEEIPDDLGVNMS